MAGCGAGAPHPRVQSDDTRAQVVELARQGRGEACPAIILFFSKLVDLPGDMLGDVKRDVAVVAPLSVLWDGGVIGGVIGVSSICPETCERHTGAIVSIQKTLSEDAIRTPSKMDGSVFPGAQEGDSTSLKW